MALFQQPEVQFAQRLASNEKSVRTKAVKKLRKYINVRSQKATGGFTGDELLKLWKGLFYCLWMQDKPLQQEELSNQISSLIHSFHNIDGQFLYLESFLQTLKREWTGIDRLRMDKFFQLVRFMFRQTFEVLKRKNWDSSVVGRFLELLTLQVLQSGSAAPSGLQFHILDLYMTELAAVGSAELTADQNLIFIEPFCKTAAKTKDWTLFRAICSSIFSTIIDQAPFAIEDLMKEMKAAEDMDSDAGQSSKEDEKDQLKEKMRKWLGDFKKGTAKQVNGSKFSEQEEDEDDDDIGHLEDSNTELPHDHDVGTVLQFDYAALADKLFELASRTSTPSHNRHKLYRIIKVLQDLSEGIFPQDEYPEEVSTDEDDDMFGSRKRMKRARGHMEENEEGDRTARKIKGKKNEGSTQSKRNKQNKDFGKDDCERMDLSTNGEKKKKRKKKKAGQGQSAVDEDSAEKSGQGPTLAQSTVNETERGLECSDTQSQSSISYVEVTEAVTPPGQSKTLLLSEVKKRVSDIVTEDVDQPKSCITDKDQSETSSKKKKRNTSEPKPEVTETGEEQLSSTTTEPGVFPEAGAPVSVKKKKRSSLKEELQTDAEADITPVSCEASQEESTATTPAKKKKKSLKVERKPAGSEGESQANVLSSETDVTLVHCEDSLEDGTTTGYKRPNDARTPAKKRSKKKSLKGGEALEAAVERKQTTAEITCEASQQTAAVSRNDETEKKDKQKKVHHGKEGTDLTSEDNTLEAAADENNCPPMKKKQKINQKDSEITAEDERTAAETPKVLHAEKMLFKFTMTPTPPKKKKKSSELLAVQTSEIKEETQLQMVDAVHAQLPLDEPDVVHSSGKPTKNKKKRKIPVVFEFEAIELEAAVEKDTGAKKATMGNDVGEPSTFLNTKKSQKKTKPPSRSQSDFITIQSNVTVPTPLFCKTKGSPSNFLSSKKSQTPNSGSKKVTFGLKNNKTAEFRKTDRSLLVSPDGSSRVPFDPKQKPKCGVLKSPPTPLFNRKMSLNTPKSMPKQRPSAADFF